MYLLMLLESQADLIRTSRSENSLLQLMDEFKNAVVRVVTLCCLVDIYRRHIPQDGTGHSGDCDGLIVDGRTFSRDSIAVVCASATVAWRVATTLMQSKQISGLCVLTTLLRTRFRQAAE
jgi:hypothetical protein